MNSQATETIGVILAAGPTHPSVQSIYGKTSSVLLPVNGKPVLFWSLRYLEKQGISRFVLVVRPSDKRIESLARQFLRKGDDLRLVQVDQDLGPGYSLLQAVQTCPADKPVLVVLGDTLFEFPAEVHPGGAEPFVLTGAVDDGTRWCLARSNDAGLVTELADKVASPPAWPALIGVYSFPQAGDLTRHLNAALQAGAKKLEMRHALQPYIGNGLRSFPSKEWLDCGNEDRLAASRRRMLAARSFNSLEVNELSGTLTKRSRDRRKFVNEINYYRVLPSDLAIFFPRVLNFSIAPEDTFLSLEYYGYPTLSELFLFEDLDLRFWKRVVNRLAGALACFRHYVLPLDGDLLRDFHLGKTHKRLRTFAQQRPDLQPLMDSPRLRINGRELQGWPLLSAQLEQRAAALFQSREGCAIHGDLCFPNILFDPVSQLVKFIDPRGSFGDAGIFGDPRYEAAKLLHSVEGGYDCLIQDMFHVSVGPGKIDYELLLPPRAEAVAALFRESIAATHNLTECRIIEGLLFLSMCPLHDDAPDRQTAMLARGLTILNECLHENCS